MAVPGRSPSANIASSSCAAAEAGSPAGPAYITAMTLRMPINAPGAGRGDAAFDMLQHELLAEKAASLGRAGAEVGRRIAALREVCPEERDAAVQHAADAVFAFVVQRDLCGLHVHEEALAALGVTREVMARVGARRVG